METVGKLLQEPPTLGEPDVAEGLVVFPLFGGGPPHGYVAFARAVESGAEAKELPEGPSVNAIVVHNPTGSPVLLLDGEEVVGAQQNRVFDGSVVVPAHSEARVAVCCVEEGRWDGAARHHRFRSGTQVGHPGLRGEMARRRDARTGRTDQGAVWSHVATRIEAAGTQAPTSAMSAVYTARGATLDGLVARVRCRPGQRGAVVFVGGRFAALDWLSSPQAYADLHPRLLRGYALDAADAPTDAPAPTRRQVEALLAQVMALPLEASTHAGTATGRPLRATADPDGHPLHTSALALDHHLAHLSVLAAE